jgi:isocitrate dehydrogenase (NAD+)
MTKHRVTLIPGDGIGPEVMDTTLRVLSAAGVSIEWEEELIGVAGLARYGETLPRRALDSIKRNKVALKGPTSTPIGGGHRSVNVELRQALELFANVRPVKSMLGTKRRYDRVDLVVVRENTEDLFSGLDGIVAPGVAVAMKITTERACTRIARFAFAHARTHGRKRVTAGHKANILKVSDGLFLQCCRGVAADYPDISYDEILVDNLCAQLVLDPTRFDILVLQNLYGDMVSDLCAGFIGGLGVAGGANVGDKEVVFEAVHGSAPDIAGQNVANPMAMILTATMMLDHLGEAEPSARIRAALGAVCGGARTLTRDLGGSASTREFGEAVVVQLQNAEPVR